MALALQVFWLLFVLAHWVTGAWSGEFAEALSSLSYGNPLGVFAAVIFSITPVVTIPALLSRTQRLLMPALACNLVSLVYGTAARIVQGDLGNGMWIFAVAMLLVTITASSANLVSVAALLRISKSQVRGQPATYSA